MSFAAIVLAAGMSRRMGVLKPLLPVSGQGAVLRCLSILKAGGIQDIIVVTGHRNQEIEAAVSSVSSVKCVHNPCYTQGMFSSVLAGVSALPLQTEGFFLLPADCCAIQPPTLTALMSGFAAIQGSRVVYPTYQGKHGHPPLIPYKFMEELFTYEGGGGMKGYLARYPADDMGIEDAGILLDMDTPEDYGALLEFLKLPTYPSVEECDFLLAKYHAGAGIIEHGRQVAEVAGKIAVKLQNKGVKLNLELLKVACLLHDMVRQEPDHAGAAARILLQEGYPAAAILVGCHMDVGGRNAAVIDEVAVLYLADKLCRQGRLVPLENTLAAMCRAFAGNPEAIAQATRRIEWAQGIMELINQQYGVGLEDIMD